MPSDDYVPREDAQFLLWAQSFKNHIVSEPATYGLTAADGASISVVVDDFAAKLAVSSDEATRTKGAVAAKDDSRFTCESLLRQYAINIKNNAGVSDEDKIDIGVRPINTNREPIEPPSTSPLLNIPGNTPGAQTVVYADSATPDSRSKPFGAVGLQLYLAVAEEESAPQADSQFHSMATRNPIGVEFSESDDGKIATYYARWVNAKGQVGPWSLPVSMRIAA